MDLKSKLSDDFKLSYSLANGIPFVFSVGNAIFCKKPIDIKWTVSRTFSFASEITIKDIDIKLKRKIMGCLLDVPDFGKLLLFNVHLCAFCPTEQRQAQINEALEFIETVKTWVRWFHGDVPCIFGGDFNIEDPPKEESDSLVEYNLITGSGFVDVYPSINGCTFGESCCIPGSNEEGCTFAVSDNPFENDTDETTRIDYFFIQPIQAFDIPYAYVVFNGDGEVFVSDLVVELNLEKPRNLLSRWR